MIKTFCDHCGEEILDKTRVVRISNHIAEITFEAPKGKLTSDACIREGDRVNRYTDIHSIYHEACYDVMYK
jgi:uncharacterized protein with ATP-grasp and redox domains